MHAVRVIEGGAPISQGSKGWCIAIPEPMVNRAFKRCQWMMFDKHHQRLYRYQAVSTVVNPRPAHNALASRQAVSKLVPPISLPYTLNPESDLCSNVRTGAQQTGTTSSGTMPLRYRNIQHALQAHSATAVSTIWMCLNAGSGIQVTIRCHKLQLTVAYRMISKKDVYMYSSAEVFLVEL